MNYALRLPTALKHRSADLLLVLITVIWGTTFTIVHQAVEQVTPMLLVALRFSLASLVLLPLLARAPRLGRRGVIVGIALGAILFTGFATQTLGLERTTPARAGFITGLNVVLVPIFGLLLGQRLKLNAIVGVILAVAGLAVLSWGCRVPLLGCTPAATSQAGWTLGDTFVLLCAAAFALHIVAVGRWAPGLHTGSLNAVQLLSVAVFATLAAIVPQAWAFTSNDETTSRAPFFASISTDVWLAALFLGVIATALVFGLQFIAQRTASPTRTALIFALEPVFAALFARLWIGELITPAVWLGGALMLGGIVVSEALTRK